MTDKLKECREALLPCPLCGGTDIREEQNDLCQDELGCEDCGCRVGNNDSKGWQRWNRRPEPLAGVALTDIADRNELELLRIEVAEWRKLKDPIAVHHNLLCGKLPWTEQGLRHILGDYSDHVSILRRDSDEYQAWIRYYNGGNGSYEDFLAASQKKGGE